MLIVASDISTEIYYSHISSEFEEAKLSGNQDFDRDSRLQLYAAPLILGYFAVSERNGDTKWTSPQNDVVHYSMASDMVLLVIQLENNQELHPSKGGLTQPGWIPATANTQKRTEGSPLDPQ